MAIGRTKRANLARWVIAYLMAMGDLLRAIWRQSGSRYWLFALLGAVALLIGFDIQVRIDLYGGAGVSPLWLTSRDYSFAETFEFAMLGLGAVVLLRLGKERGAAGLTGMALILLSLAIDNRAQLHESVGQWLAPYMAGETREMREQSGEMLFMLAPISLCAALALYHLWRSSVQQSAPILVLVGLIGVTAIFALGLDSIHAMMPVGSSLELYLGAVEDGGELICFTAIGWFCMALGRLKAANGTKPTTKQA